mmetsp:Transcript_110710/g.292331  ORF Transcript_110710/g.292331 Transcript_110710/m.292331 type:complete len:242 (-) Transcript_110710:765-1490(-)
MAHLHHALHHRSPAALRRRREQEDHRVHEGHPAAAALARGRHGGPGVARDAADLPGPSRCGEEARETLGRGGGGAGPVESGLPCHAERNPLVVALRAALRGAAAARGGHRGGRRRRAAAGHDPLLRHLRLRGHLQGPSAPGGDRAPRACAERRGGGDTDAQRDAARIHRRRGARSLQRAEPPGAPFTGRRLGVQRHPPGPGQSERSREVRLPRRQGDRDPMPVRGAHDKHIGWQHRLEIAH